MEKRNGKKVTIDQLASMVARGFEGVFEHMEKKLATKADLGDLKEDVGKAIKNVDEKLSKAVRDVDLHLVAYISSNEKIVDNLSEIVTEHEERINRVEDKLAGVRR